MEEFTRSTHEVHDGSNWCDSKHCIFSLCPRDSKHSIPPATWKYVSFTAPKSLLVLQSTFGLAIVQPNMVTLSSDHITTIESSFANVFFRHICQPLFATSLQSFLINSLFISLWNFLHANISVVMVRTAVCILYLVLIATLKIEFLCAYYQGIRNWPESFVAGPTS